MKNIRHSYGRPFFLLLLICSITNSYSQQGQRADSLLNVYRSQTADSSKLKALNDLFAEYRSSNDSMAKAYLDLSVSFGANAGFPEGFAKALYNKGQYEGRHGNFDSSDHYISKALKLFGELGDKLGQASCNMAYGLNMYDKSKFTEALSFFLKALRLREQAGDEKSMSNSYTWIGNVYNTGLFKPNEALTYYSKALAIQLKYNDEKGLAATYNNLGNVSYFLKQYREALKNYLKSTELKERFNDQKGLSIAYINLGNAYAALKEFDKAVPYFERSVKLYEEFGDLPGVISGYINIGNVYFDQKKYREAIPYHEKALEASKEIDYREGMREAAYNLAICYEEIGEPAKALNYFKYSGAINDSILNQDFNRQIVEMQTKYETEKKDLEIARNKAELEIKEEQVAIKNGVIAGIAALLILVVIIGYQAYRRKQMQQKAELDAELARQKDIRTRAVIEAEEKERVRIATDLHDGVGQLLSAAKLNLSSLEDTLQITVPEQQHAFKSAVELLDDSVKEVRAVSHNMMPNTLLKLGLASAVKEFVVKIQNTPNLKVNLEIVGLTHRLEQEKETALYRAIQEVVSNIIRHAKATELTLQLIQHEKELSILIEDNGVGFDTTRINDFTGIGLKNIISRIEFINGTVHFDSAPNRGTTVVIDVAL